MVEVHLYLLKGAHFNIVELRFCLYKDPDFSSVPRNGTDLLYSGLFILFQGVLLRACRLITSLLPLSFIPHPLKEFENVLGMVLCFTYEPRKLQIIKSG